jgi:hypothetical protein
VRSDTIKALLRAFLVSRRSIFSQRVFVSDTLKAAIIGFVASAILAPIITYLIAKFWGGRPRLRAKLSVHELSIPTFLQTYLTSPSVEPDVQRKLTTLSNLRGYMKLTLNNLGKEKTEPLTLSATGWIHDYLVQIDNQPELLRPVDGKVPIGYLPSKGERVLRIWSTGSGTWGYIGVVNLFKIRADTFYKTSFKFPFPTYIQDIIRGWVLTLFLVFGVLLAFSQIYKSFLPSWCP